MSSLSLTPTEPERCKFLDPDSIIQVCDGADQVVVYGWKHCNYHEVSDAIIKMSKASDFPIKRIFDYTMGNPFKEGCCTLEGRDLNNLVFEGTELLSTGSGVQTTLDLVVKVIPRTCKTAITNLVLENYKRILEGDVPIPLLFCIDIDDNPQPFSIDRMTSKELQFNTQITYKELRRAYKLCTYYNPAVRLAAEKTFKFVRLKKIGDVSYALQQIAAPWDHPNRTVYWLVRTLLKTSPPKHEDVDWRKQLDWHVNEYESAFASDESDVEMETQEEEPASEGGTKRKAEEIEDENPSSPRASKRARVDEIPPFEPIPTFSQEELNPHP